MLEDLEASIDCGKTSPGNIPESLRVFLVKLRDSVYDRGSSESRFIFRMAGRLGSGMALSLRVLKLRAVVIIVRLEMWFGFFDRVSSVSPAGG